MDRQEALIMLKELVANNNLVDPSFVHISLRKPRQYQIQIKCDYNKMEIEAYAKKHSLSIEEDKERKCLVIFKP